MTDRNSVGELMEDGKRLWLHMREYARLELVDKLSLVLGALALGAVILALATVAVFCLCMYAVMSLQVFINNIALSYAIVGAFLLVLIAIVYVNRQRWIIRPIIAAFMREFFDEKPKDAPPS